jgi:hypothetical protein
MPKGDIIVKSVFEAIATFPDGTSRFLGCLTAAGVQKTVNTEDLRCGIYNGLKTILQLDSDMTVTLDTVGWNDYFMELNSGNGFELAQTLEVKTYEKVPFVVSTADATATITGTPIDNIVEVQDAQGTILAATYLTGTVTVTGGATTVAGTEAYVIYKKSITADALDLRSDVLPKVFDLTLHGVAYDPTEGGSVVADLYFNFPRVQPEGAMDMNTATSTNATNQLVMRVLPSNGSFGTYMVEEVV